MSFSYVSNFLYKYIVVHLVNSLILTNHLTLPVRRAHDQPGQEVTRVKRPANPPPAGRTSTRSVSFSIYTQPRSSLIGCVEHCQMGEAMSWDHAWGCWFSGEYTETTNTDVLTYALVCTLIINT